MTGSALAVVDPFALPAESKVADRESIITGGRYRLPWKNGDHKKGGWQRVTNLVGAYSDQFALRGWEQEQIFMGLQKRPDLFREVLSTPFETMEKEERRDWVARFVDLCKDASGANVGKDHGNSRHAMVELAHGGKPIPHMSKRARVELALYGFALKRNELRALDGMQERRVLIEELEAVGTLDNVLEDLRTQLLHIGDLKTQKRFWTFLELCAQLACYARAVAMWDPAAGRWVDMPKVSLDIGFVLWMPRETEDGEPTVEVIEADLQAGWKTAKRAREVVEDRSAAKSKRTPRAWLRAAPPITDVERFAAYFAGVETMAEGRRVTEAAKKAGAWCDELAQTAALAAARIAAETS